MEIKGICDLHLVEGWESLWDKWVQEIIDRKEQRYQCKQLFQGILLKRAQAKSYFKDGRHARLIVRRDHPREQKTDVGEKPTITRDLSLNKKN